MDLVSRSSTNKIRVVTVYYELEDDVYVISRFSGQYKGKMTEHPKIIIDEGKAKRTLEQQVELKYQSLIKEYKDKGYKALDESIENYSEEELNEIIGSVVTGQSGVPKPQLAKQADKITNSKVFDKDYYASRKIDGLRILIYKDNDGELKTASRGGTNYDAAMYEILSNSQLKEIFNEYPNLILDGEGYKYGLTLQQINSVARTQVTAVDYEVLQFYWYDIVDIKKSFEDRWKLMQEIATKYNIGWDPERQFSPDELRIQLVPQVSVSGYDNMMKLHNDYVEEGWEGVVIRLKSAIYKPNSRTNNMIKIKQYKTDEFKVLDYELGLRGSEDMCFICETPNGKQFKAKPWGDRAQKQWYIDNFDSECKNHFATIKYFYYSDGNDTINGVPLQPSAICIRLEEDM